MYENIDHIKPLGTKIYTKLCEHNKRYVHTLPVFTRHYQRLANTASGLGRGHVITST